jgi:hypothetical protein
MRTSKPGTVLTALTAALTMAAPAFGYGPKHEEGDRAFDACVANFTKQIDRGVVAGGGPKGSSIEFGSPTNCDHFWQAPVGDGGVDLIGNSHWPPPGSTK